MKYFFIVVAIISNTAFASALSCVDITKNLSKGSESNLVLALQEFLNSKGYLRVNPNGYFGPATVSAVKTYQKNSGLPVSGKVLALTRISLKKETCSTANLPKTSNQASYGSAIVQPSTSYVAKPISQTTTYYASQPVTSYTTQPTASYNTQPTTSYTTTQPTTSYVAQPTTSYNTQPVTSYTPITTSQPAVIPQGKYRNGSYTGSMADASYGFVQVKAVISGGKITDVVFLSYPNGDPKSIGKSSNAMPILIQEAIAIQDANVNAVSGASFTSAAYTQSLTSALSQARV